MENPHVDAERTLEQLDDPHVAGVLRALGLGRAASDDINEPGFHDASNIE